MKKIKNIQRCLLVSLVPILTPMSAFAEPEKKNDWTSSDHKTKASTASWRASEVIGLNVKNADDETVGEVEDLVFKRQSGEIFAVIISTGGFLGVADTFSTFPMTALRYDDQAKEFKTKLTKEQLGKAPQFKSDAWPDFSAPDSMEALRSFRDMIGGDVSAPDNSAQNEEEMERDTVNPTDQGSSEEDIKITQDIRSEIMDKDLSFNAKNIKIITRYGKVMLKGVVKSDTEHQTILKVVKNHVEAEKIVDQLKVKSE